MFVVHVSRVMKLSIVNTDVCGRGAYCIRTAIRTETTSKCRQANTSERIYVNVFYTYELFISFT